MLLWIEPRPIHSTDVCSTSTDLNLIAANNRGLKEVLLTPSLTQQILGHVLEYKNTLGSEFSCNYWFHFSRVNITKLWTQHNWITQQIYQQVTLQRRVLSKYQLPPTKEYFGVFYLTTQEGGCKCFLNVLRSKMIQPRVSFIATVNSFFWLTMASAALAKFVLINWQAPALHPAGSNFNSDSFFLHTRHFRAAMASY